MSNTKTTSFTPTAEIMAGLREEAAALRSENRELKYIVGKCRFEDEPDPVCDICSGMMDGGGDFAVCHTCARAYRRVVEWATVGIVPLDDIG